jgi:hypothetical protein
VLTERIEIERPARTPQVARGGRRVGFCTVICQSWRADRKNTRGAGTFRIGCSRDNTHLVQRSTPRAANEGRVFSANSYEGTQLGWQWAPLQPIQWAARATGSAQAPTATSVRAPEPMAFRLDAASRASQLLAGLGSSRRRSRKFSAASIALHSIRRVTRSGKHAPTRSCSSRSMIAATNAGARSHQLERSSRQRCHRIRRTSESGASAHSRRPRYRDVVSPRSPATISIQ